MRERLQVGELASPGAAGARRPPRIICCTSPVNHPAAAVGVPPAAGTRPAVTRQCTTSCCTGWGSRGASGSATTCAATGSPPSIAQARAAEELPPLVLDCAAATLPSVPSVASYPTSPHFLPQHTAGHSG